MKKFQMQLHRLVQWRKDVLAFTLIELAIVIAIILVLLGLLVPKLLSMAKTSRCTAAITALKKFADELKAKLILPNHNVNPDVERQHLQNLINEVKKDCNDPTVAGSQDLKNSLNQLIQLVTEQVSSADNPTGWEGLKNDLTSLWNAYFGS